MPRIKKLKPYYYEKLRTSNTIKVKQARAAKAKLRHRRNRGF